MPTQREIEDVIDECIHLESEGDSKFPGMTYEQGVKATIEWLKEGGENPLED